MFRAQMVVDVGGEGYKRISHKTYSSNAVCDAAVSGGSSVILWPAGCACGWAPEGGYMRMRICELRGTPWSPPLL